MKKHIGVAILLATVAVTLPSCATILGGAAENLTVTVEEAPANTEVTIIGLTNGERFTRRGATASLQLSRATDYQISVKAAGYHTEDVIIRRNIRNLFWLNLCCGGVVGMVVDFATNNMYEHDRTNVTMRLEAVRKSQFGDFSVLPVHFTNPENGAQCVIEVPAKKVDAQ